MLSEFPLWANLLEKAQTKGKFLLSFTQIHTDKVVFDIFPYFKNIDGYPGDVTAGEHDDNRDENCGDTLVSLRS